MGIQREIGLAVMLGWGLVAAWLFRACGPRRGALIAVIGGNLVVPCLVFDVVAGSRLQFTQPVAIGLAVALGVLVGDPRALARLRPRWLDLPMLAYVAYPLCGLFTNGPRAGWDVGDMVLQRGFGVLLPYAAGRRYLGDAEGARRIGVAIVVGTLLYVPVVAYEALLGPRWYLERLIYGVIPYEPMINRLGGWRPDGFFLNGLTLATWMALAAAVAAWLWLGRIWRPTWGPSWWPALVLVLASVGCRGVYGYIALGLGLTAVMITRAFRTRWGLALLLLVPLVYVGLRVGGVWDARGLSRLAGLTGRAGTVEFRLLAEDTIIRRVLARHPLVGFGVQIWHYQDVHETLAQWPDGQWLLSFWSGGLAGLALHWGALYLLPAGLGLAWSWPRGPRDPGTAGAMVLGLVLFLALCLLDGLHNNAYFTPAALIAGSLVGIALGRRREPDGPGATHTTAPIEPARPRLEPSLIPIVTATACLLYVFGHGPVAGRETVKLIGGLGAGLLFASAGGVGAWASGRVPLTRIGLFAGLFAALGVSFNLALHPHTRPAATADILQGLALCGLAVSCWRRWVGPHAWGDAILGVLPLLVHFWLRPVLPGFPGSQYLVADLAGEQSLFPLFPWLTLSALGARAVGESPASSGVAAALFAAATLTVWRSDPSASGAVKFPMNLSYALLSCAAIEAAFTLAHGLKRLGAVARPATWLGRNWLIYFYLHFAVAFVLGRSGIGPAPAVWALLAAGSIGATWLWSRAAAPLSGAFRSPAAWIVPTALIIAAGAWPGLPPRVVSGLAGVAGLIFAAYHGTLAYVIVNHPSSAPWPFRIPTRRAAGFGRGLVRLAILLALLALPEVVGYLGGLVSGPADPSPSVVPGDGSRSDRSGAGGPRRPT